MAPMAIHGPYPLKRTASQARFDIPPAKKQNHGNAQHHKAKWDVQREYRQDVQTQNKAAQELLTRSLDLALEAVGFEGAGNVAMEAFRMETEEYMAHFLRDVRQSMMSSRRRQTTPEDFLQALHANQLSLRSLIPHLDPPIPPAKSQYPLEQIAPDPDYEQVYRPANSLFAEASHTQAYIPRHFPPLPDKHTYQATPHFAQREQDPRKLRERAREESLLGEQALRKLVKDATVGTVDSSKQKPEDKRPLSSREKMHQMWLDTMSAVSQEQDKGLHEVRDEMDSDVGKGKEREGQAVPPLRGQFSSAVNYEQKFWRKPARAG